MVEHVSHVERGAHVNTSGGVLLDGSIGLARSSATPMWARAAACSSAGASGAAVERVGPAAGECIALVERGAHVGTSRSVLLIKRVERTIIEHTSRAYKCQSNAFHRLLRMRQSIGIEPRRFGSSAVVAVLRSALIRRWRRTREVELAQRGDEPGHVRLAHQSSPLLLGLERTSECPA